MADDKLTGTRRALKAKEARNFAKDVCFYANMANRYVERDEWSDAERVLGYLFAYADILRDIVSELER